MDGQQLSSAELYDSTWTSRWNLDSKLHVFWHELCWEPPRNVPKGCRRQTWGKSAADHLGPAGRACWLHGGQVCNIPGCQAQPRGRALADDLGAAGIRCQTHLKQLTKLGPKRCRSPGEQLLPVEERCSYQKGDWRCKRHRAGSRYCEHHEALYQKRLHKMWLKRRPKLRPKRSSSPDEQLPPEEERCSCTGGSWRCKRRRVGSRYCEHHEALYQKRLQRMGFCGEKCDAGGVTVPRAMVGNKVRTQHTCMSQTGWENLMALRLHSLLVGNDFSPSLGRQSWRPTPAEASQRKFIVTR